MPEHTRVPARKEGRCPDCHQDLPATSSSPRARCLERQQGPLPCFANEAEPPGTTLALTRCCQAGDKGLTRHLSHGLRMGLAWASHGPRMGFARAYAVCYAPSHPSSSGTMALVVWTMLPM